MKISILIAFFTFLNFKVSAQKRCSCDSICFCETLIKYLKNNWNDRVKNADSIKLISIKEIGVVQTEKNKKKYIDLLTDDTAWVAHPAMYKRLFIDLLPYSSVQGKDIHFYDTTRRLMGSYSSFLKKQDRVNSLNESIKLTDKYYEITFEVNGRIIMSPTICKTDQYTCIGFLDNILSHLTGLYW